MIGEHAVADSAEIGVYVQLYGLLDLLGFQPAGLGRRFQRPRFGLFPIDLAGRLSLFPFTVAVAKTTGSTGLSPGAVKGKGWMVFVRASKQT